MPKQSTSQSSPTETEPVTDPRQFNGEGTEKIYALLIGIDGYEYGSPKLDLKGCVRDSKEVERYLRENIAQADQRLHLRCLRNPVSKPDSSRPVAAEEHRSATRAEMIKGFTEFLTQAGPKDAVFIHYSGHGTTYKKPQELQRLEAKENDNLRGEALVPQDTFMRNAKGVMLAPVRDQEIRWMISRIAANNPHIVVILDCCNSSGNTRAFDQGEVSVRYTPPDEAAPSDIASFVFYQQDAKLREQFDQKRSDINIPQGRHLALHACHSYELAKETGFKPGPKRYGIFTYYVLQTLRTTRGRISYRDLIKLVRTKTVAKVAHQSPQYYSYDPTDIDQYFLGGTVAKDQFTYTVIPGSKAGQGLMDAGSLHGIHPLSEGTTHLTLFPPGTDLKTAKASDGLAATVTAVNAHESDIRLVDDQQFADGVAFYQAVITAAPMPKTKVSIVAEIDEKIVPPDQDEKLAAGIAYLKTAIKDHPLIELTDQAADRQFKVFVYRYKNEDRFRIAEKDKLEALVAPKVGLTEKNARALAEELAHIARWQRTLTLNNDHPAIIRPDDLELIVIDEQGNEIKNHNGSITFHFITDDLPLQPPRRDPDGKEYIIEFREGDTDPGLKFRVALRNKQQVMLYCALVQLSSDFSIQPDRLPPDTHLGKTSFVDDDKKINREVWEAYSGSHEKDNLGQENPKGQYIYFYLPEHKEEDTDHFKLIASTEQFDPVHLRQDALERASSTRSAGDNQPPKSQLDSLMPNVSTRATRPSRSAKKKIADWFTTTISIKLKRIPPRKKATPDE